MKFKDSFWSQLLAAICLIFTFAILFPVALFCLILFFISKFITMPFNYYKYRHSQYQKDFPHKFNFLDTFHIDDIPYSIIKENELPIQYIKWSKEYDMRGYFIYKDILLDFSEPFFFNPETNTFAFNPEEEVEEDEEGEESENNNNQDMEDVEKCLSVEETKAFILNDFNNNIQQYECKQVVFLYSQEKLKKSHGGIALQKINELNDFIVYNKDTLHQVLKEFIDMH